jgi:hypothetical protein
MIAGSAVAFVAKKNNLDNPETLCYASKSEGMFVRDSLIFRSDSNGEDLEGYAGARVGSRLKLRFADSIRTLPDSPQGGKLCLRSLRGCLKLTCACCVRACSFV